MPTEYALPGDDQIGETQTWALPNGKYQGKYPDKTWVPLPDIHLHGTLIGYASSEVNDTGMVKDRWIEIRIFKTEDGYALHTAARSSIPGETNVLTRLAESKNPDTIIERLVERKPYQPPKLSITSQRALEQASVEDEEMQEAYVAHRAAYLRTA